MNEAPENTQPGQTETGDLATDELVRLIRNGRRECYEHIVRRYQVDVAQIVHALVLDRPATEDLVQDVFIRGYTHLEQYRIGEGFGRWIRAIARNAVRQELRRRYREAGRMKTYATLLEARLDRDESDELVRQEHLQSLRECVAQLDAESAEVVRLRYMKAEPYEKIATVFGRSAGALRTWLYRVRSRLQECLEAKGVLP